MTNIKKYPFFLLIFTLTMGLSVSTVYAQVQEQVKQVKVYKLVGKVVDANTGEALSDVEIEITNPDVESAAQRVQKETGDMTGGIVTETTNDQGEFTFAKLPRGEYTVMIDYEAYETWERNINLNQDSQLTIKLQPSE